MAEQEQGSEPPEFSVFVGDLAYDVDHALLDATFKSQFSSCTSALVMMDPVTGRSRGFGFVRFSDESERDRAITEMNGVFVGSKPVRVSLATARPNPTARSTASGGTGPSPGELDPNNTTLFVGGLSPAVSEPELHAAFAAFGDIVYTKIPAGKGCGFVQFVQRPAAELAMERMQGCMMSNMPIRVSWGKSSRPPPTSALVGTAVALQQHHQQQQQQQQGLPATMIAGGVYGGGAYGPYGATAAGYGALQPGGYGAAGGVGPYGLPYGAAAFDAAAAAAYGAQMGAYMAFPGDAAAFTGYGFHAASQAQGAGSSATSPGATARSVGAVGAAAGVPGRGGGGYVDPLAAMSNMAKLNAALMQQQHRHHLPMMAGHHHYVRVPVAMPVQHM